jgi:hypothetical protein
MTPEQTKAHCGFSREPGGGNGHKRRFRQIALAGFLLCSGLVSLIQQLDFEFALAYGLTVPDSVNMILAIQNMWEEDRLLTHDSGFQAVVAIYGWTWLLHPSFCFVVNCVLMLIYVMAASPWPLALVVMSVLAMTDRFPPAATPEVKATPAYVW